MHTDNTVPAESPGPAIDLDSLYAPPAERIQKAVRDRLSDFHEAYLRQASFFCLATIGEHGLDASPRGGPPGFVQVLDDRTVAFADWPGNNRIESLRNLQADEPLAALDRGSMDHVQRTLAALNREGQQAAPVAGHGPRCVIVAHWDAMQGVAWDDVLDLPDQPPLR
jgi:predicted pyridoxine 5'-phosphate oxidase superfamily flavin-nucleotide-binding protein